jgi:exosortase E/protease (VPEID-CTERM system)
MPRSHPQPQTPTYEGPVLSSGPPSLAASSRITIGLALRILLFIVLSGGEWVPISRWSALKIGGDFLLRAGVVCASVFLAFGFFKAGDTFRRVSKEVETVPIGWGYLAGHIFSLLVFLCLSQVRLGAAPLSGRFYFMAAACYFVAALSIALAGFALVPPKFVGRLLRSTGFAWAYALPLGLLAWRLMSFPPYGGFRIWTGPFWRPVTELTFLLVKTFLLPFLPELVADRATMTLGSPSFLVTIQPACNGWEGTALMAVFSISWICLLRREFRFPRALLLIPLAMASIWISNAVRITVLILIGAAGAPDVAMSGFHSEAGWIAFNGVALAFAVGSRKIGWFTVRKSEAPSRPSLWASPTAAHLLPFLAILAVAMISRAVSSGFEWLYPIRPLAAAAALWVFRSKYAGMNWRAGWFSLVLGSAAFLFWLALAPLSGAQSGQGIALGLASLPGPARIGWLACRVAGAVIAVPLAEELAFRGFLIRRLICPDFDLLSPRDFTWFSVLGSSLIFGLLHGSHWLAGMIAGLLYAAAFLRRGRIGDAVVAHATTNAWLAAWVLWSGNWSLW